MRVTPTVLPEILIVEPDVFADERGFFLESFQARKYADAGIDVNFVQDNHSCSQRDTLRGLHAQLTRPQGKLIRVIAGEIFDVAVDIRRGSPRFGKWMSVRLSARNFKQCWIPPGFIHGFCVLSEVAEVEYKCTEYYDPSCELRVQWNDPAIGIDWPVRTPLLSAKDQIAAPLSAAEPLLPRYEGA
jgi:dTDP-4-dehydrorhamnose 3,5-epimerase